MGDQSGSPTIAAESPPWWRVGMVWVALGGPLAVVLASLITAVVAFRGADPVLRDAAPAATSPDARAPAIAARNHAASPSR